MVERYIRSETMEQNEQKSQIYMKRKRKKEENNNFNVFH